MNDQVTLMRSFSGKWWEWELWGGGKLEAGTTRDCSRLWSCVQLNAGTCLTEFSPNVAWGTDFEDSHYIIQVAVTRGTSEEPNLAKVIPAPQINLDREASLIANQLPLWTVQEINKLGAGLI